jgi:3D (Asp-Asp-Asp) domain-containing protein
MMNRRKLLTILAVGAIWTLGFGSAPAAAAGNLDRGSRGGEVAQMQAALNAEGYNCGAADGIFGVNTQKAVLRFQQDRGLTPDGIVGPRTHASLFPAQGWPGPRTLTVVATAYCPCDKCNYPYGGLPSYMGLPLAYGVVAVDPGVIPMGSRLYVPGYGEGVAADQGGAIRGNRVDLCFPTHQEALKWGVKTLAVTVYGP